MNWVFTSLILLTAGQTALCGFGFPLFLSYVGRSIFLLRLLGSVVPHRVSMGCEAGHLFFVFLGMIFTRTGVDWVYVLLSLLFCAVVCLLYIIDDRFYLYVVAEDGSKEEKEG